MGQVALRGSAAELEELVPGDIAGLAAGRMRYTMLTTDSGGILDDVMVTNVGNYLFLVINAGRKKEDLAHLQSMMTGVSELSDRSLLALQGPDAAAVMARYAPGVEQMPFMSARPFEINGSRLAIMRSGYTGEDGFEISVPTADVVRIAELLLDEDEVEPAGLGARDSLRLEAGLCLWGHDIDETTTPVEAGLAWTIGRRRREQGGFPGDVIILEQLRNGTARRRVGILPLGRAPAREGTEIVDRSGRVIGEVTSGGYGPSLGKPVAMGYVDSLISGQDTPIELVIRGTRRPGRLNAMPFVAHRYFRG